MSPSPASVGEEALVGEGALINSLQRVKGPIGMFDSGFGGLTVARALFDLLPSEDVVYIGDTGRYPYGPRPLDEVRGFTGELAASLVEDFGVKAIIVACNTAASAGLDEIRATLRVPIIDVIEPGARSLVEATSTGRVGVIGTVGTISSGAYVRAVAEAARLADRDVSLTSAACPGFVEFVERGQTTGDEVTVLAERLLAPVCAAEIDALLFGCTHYPYLARVIKDVVGAEVTLVSSADETAFAAARLLDALGLLRPRSPRPGTRTFLSSGDVESFRELGARLLGPELDHAAKWPVACAAPDVTVPEPTAPPRPTPEGTPR